MTSLVLYAPSGLFGEGTRFPRALPWAVSFRPFGACGEDSVGNSGDSGDTTGVLPKTRCLKNQRHHESGTHEIMKWRTFSAFSA